MKNSDCRIKLNSNYRTSPTLKGIKELSKRTGDTIYFARIKGGDVIVYPDGKTKRVKRKLSGPLPEIYGFDESATYTAKEFNAMLKKLRIRCKTSENY